MYSATYFFNKMFSYLAITFPDCMDYVVYLYFLDVFAPHSRDEEEESLIDESQREGMRFSEQFRAKYGTECTQFMESSLNDAVFLIFDASHVVCCFQVVKITHNYIFVIFPS